MTDQPTPIVAPVLSKYGVLEWPVRMLDPQRTYENARIMVESSGTLSLVGIAWTLSPDNAVIVSKALNNAAKWMATSWSPDFYDRLHKGGTDE